MMPTQEDQYPMTYMYWDNEKSWMNSKLFEKRVRTVAMRMYGHGRNIPVFVVNTRYRLQLKTVYLLP